MHQQKPTVDLELSMVTNRHSGSVFFSFWWGRRHDWIHFHRSQAPTTNCFESIFFCVNTTFSSSIHMIATCLKFLWKFYHITFRSRWSKTSFDYVWAFSSTCGWVKICSAVMKTTQSSQRCCDGRGWMHIQLTIQNSKAHTNIIFIYCQNHGFPTFLRSRTTWAPHIVNAYHFFQNN